MKSIFKFNTGSQEKPNVTEIQQTQVVETQTVELTETEIVAQIHDEFFTSCDKQYLKMQENLNIFVIPNENKINRLISLGFTSLPEVKKAQEIMRLREQTQEQMRLIETYRSKYPLNKFISEDDVKEICKKYGLILGKVSQYIGEVPENKITGMESLKVKEEDLQYIQRFVEYNVTYSLSYEEYMEKTKKPSDNVFGRSKFESVDELMIAAPEKDFIILQNQSVENYQIKTIVRDPVVLKPVQGGFLIVEAWGPGSK